MSILELQRSYRTLGRIRTGEKRATKSGKMAPAKLTAFRLTSPSQQTLLSAAKVYGGDVTEWTSPNGAQWELYLPTDMLEILVPPQPVSQWYELWSGAGCIRRCDGAFEHKSEGPCLCDPESRECKATTRLNVVLPNVADIGVWLLETHGIYAAREIPATVEMINQFRTGLTRATLRLDQRTRRGIGKDGKPETRHFGVPVIELRHTLEELVDAPVLALPTAEPAPERLALPEPEKPKADREEEIVEAEIVEAKPEPAVVVGKQERIEAPAEDVTVVDWKAVSAETGVSVSTMLRWARSHDLGGTSVLRLIDVTGPLAEAIVEMAQAKKADERAVETVKAAFPGTEEVA